MNIQLNENLKILYVEDNVIVRESTYGLLQEYFMYIDIAEDGQIGFEKYKAFYAEHGSYYDIVFTDIIMPNMNGIEMAKSILAEDPTQNIVVISAHNESDYLVQLINMGISKFILKPIELNPFNTIVSRIIDTASNKKTLKKQQVELMKMNKLLESANKKAEDASYQKSMFLANMSHEIRTPLNAIMGFISLLHQNEEDSKKLKYLNVIQNSSESLLQIINDILDISKIESGKMTVEKVSFNPYEDLIGIGELFQAKAAEKELSLKIKFNDNMPMILNGDILKIKQIFSNLLSNAIKFTPEMGTVKCIIWYKGGILNIRVKDYGIGIPEAKQKYIFETFSQAENSIVREYGGTGLGLSICMQLTDMLGGTLTMKSQENVGTDFLLSIPMSSAEEAQEEENVLEDNHTPKSGHILLVEDNEANRMFLGIVLENIGLNYDTAVNGLEAVEKFKTLKYDLILMDENMPKLSGTDATKRILQIEKKLNLPHTPIISLTANAFEGDKQRFLDAGMDDYLSKPIYPDMLTDLIHRYLS